MDLFDQAPVQPLATRLRPKDLNEFCGQSHLLGPGKVLRKAIEENQLHSMILWGPPGVGKTTLANIIAERCNVKMQMLSAVFSGVKDIRAAVDHAKMQLQQNGTQTLLFVDEIHRFSKSQQDAFLPFVEDGTFTFIGATTENPSFEINNALLSRARVYVLKALTDEEIVSVLKRGLQLYDEKRSIVISEEHLRQIAIASDGDARRALNFLETLIQMAGENVITESFLSQVISSQVKQYDKSGDIYYSQISALHKSVRGSSPDAALYWYARMLDAGCDPLYVARRLVAIASEDIGNADPRALQIALNAWDAFTRLGPAEGERSIAHAVVYLACAPKSNAVYDAFNAAKELVKKTASLDVPNHLCNAPTKLMKELNVGSDYRYPHDEANSYAAGEEYFPESLHNTKLYFPKENGLEAKIKARLTFLRSLDENSDNKRSRNP